MTDSIIVKILGDYGPFSRMGKSIGYQITIGQSNYLIDCGAPLFQQIGGHGLKNINGLIVTHCHDDHKRWFSDLALFNMYAPDFRCKVLFLTSEDLNEELKKASGPSLDRSLSNDSKSVVDIGYDEYFNFNIIGPRARYRIVSVDEGGGKKGTYIIDRNGNKVHPDIAKVIINNKTKRPRMLFKDPNYGEWVEPESFYPFSSKVFYEEEQNIYTDKEGFTIQAIKSPVWHGIIGIGIKIKTDKETLVFSSDTVDDKELWIKLYTEKRTQRLNMSRREFESSHVIYGDINDYIERIWSEERYKNAVNAFNEAVVIHDVSGRNSVVHTDYENLKYISLSKYKTILTHSPDKMTSEWVLSNSGKTYKIKDGKFYEVVSDNLFTMEADIYHKESGRYYVGYRNEKGKYLVYENMGLLGLASGEIPDNYTPLYKVDLYEDISGRYFPKLDNNDAIYFERKDGKVEVIEFTENGSTGRIIEDCRGRIFKK